MKLHVDPVIGTVVPSIVGGEVADNRSIHRIANYRRSGLREGGLSVKEVCRNTQTRVWEEAVARAIQELCRAMSPVSATHARIFMRNAACMRDYRHADELHALLSPVSPPRYARPVRSRVALATCSGRKRRAARILADRAQPGSGRLHINRKPASLSCTRRRVGAAGLS